MTKPVNLTKICSCIFHVWLANRDLPSRFHETPVSTRILFSLRSALELKAVPLYLLPTMCQTRSTVSAHIELVSPRRETIGKQRHKN